MFKRIILEAWANSFVISAFIATAGIFLAYLFHALFLGKKEVMKLALLPLAEDEQSVPRPEKTTDV